MTHLAPRRGWRALPLAALLVVALPCGGCWQVLEHHDDDDDDSEDLWMDWDGSVEVSPAALSLAAAVGDAETAELEFVETGGEAGVELTLSIEGDAAGALTIDPGDWTVTVVPDGALTIAVSFAPAAGATDADAELIAVTSGSPAELRVPIATEVLAD